MGRAFLNGLSVISTNDCCTLLVACLEKAFHVGSTTFTTENFKCMVFLKKSSLQKNVFTGIKNKTHLISVRERKSLVPQTTLRFTYISSDMGESAYNNTQNCTPLEPPKSMDSPEYTFHLLKK